MTDSQTWNIVLKAESDFWEEEITATDEDGDPITFSDTSLTITPNPGSDDETPIVWNVSNGKLTMPSPGVFVFLVLASEIAAYDFEYGHYCWSVTYTNGRIDGSWMTGLVSITRCQ